MDSVVPLLQAALNPGSVAVVGASSDPAKFGGRVMQFLVKHRFAGRIVPINPGAKDVLGIVAYPRIADAPRTIRRCTTLSTIRAAA